MSSKEEQKARDAAERIKAATLSAAKGPQAERAAAATVRNVNAYGQKEEGPSRWQEKREAKRRMSLMSTETLVKLGERKDLTALASTIGGLARCQMCYQSGHWTCQCTNERIYISQLSSTQLLKNPKLKAEAQLSYDQENPDIKEKTEKRSKKSKRKYKSDSDSASDSEASVFKSESELASGSDYSSRESSSVDSSSSDSEEERRRRRRRRNRRAGGVGSTVHRPRHLILTHDSESGSDDNSSQRTSRRHGKRGAKSAV